MERCRSAANGANSVTTNALRFQPKFPLFFAKITHRCLREFDNMHGLSQGVVNGIYAISPRVLLSRSERSITLESYGTTRHVGYCRVGGACCVRSAKA